MPGVGGVGGRGPVDQASEVSAPAPTSAPASAQAASAAAKELAVGARGEAVKTLQTLLNGAGAKLKADGIFGNATATAVSQFQKAKGLPATGRADEATMAALQKAQPGASTTGAATSGDTIPPQNLVKSFQLQGGPDEWFPRALTATIGGKVVTLADDAIKARSFENGRYLAWSTPKGAGGFENEGQGIMVYDAKTGKTTQVMSEYFMVEDIQFAKLPNGKHALVVPMMDGGLGLERLAIVDLQRGGECAYIQGAKDVKVSGGTVTYTGVKVTEDGDMKPTGKKTLDLAKALTQPIITNKRDWE